MCWGRPRRGAARIPVASGPGCQAAQPLRTRCSRTALRPEGPLRAHRDRRQKAPRLRHRHLYPKRAARPLADRSRHRLRTALPGAGLLPCADARAELSRGAQQFRSLLDPRAVLDPVGPSSGTCRSLSRAALRPSAAQPAKVGRDDPRLHSPDVPGVSAEPDGADVRAGVPLGGRPRVEPDPDGLRDIQARHPAVLRVPRKRSASSTTASTIASACSRPKRKCHAWRNAIS